MGLSSIDVIQIDMNNIDVEYNKCIFAEFSLSFETSPAPYKLFFSNSISDLLNAILAVHAKLPKDYCMQNTTVLIDSNIGTLLTLLPEAYKRLPETKQTKFLQCVQPNIRALLILG